MKRSLPVLVTALAYAACSPARKTTVQRVDLDTLSVTARPLDRNRYQATATREWDILHTDIEIERLDQEAKTATATTTLRLHPYAYETDSLVLDAQSMLVQSVNQIRSGGTATPVAFSHEDDRLTVRWPRTWTPADTLTLTIAYTARPYGNTTGGSAAIREDRGLYFINTDGAIPGKPHQIWTQGETESNSHWFPTIDKPNERFTVRLAVTVPDSMTTLSNGALVSQTISPAAGGTRRDVWEMNLPIQPYVVVLAVGRFAKVVDQPWKGKEVAYYVEPEYAPYAKGMFRHTPEMIDFFSRKTGVPYPWNKYSQIVVRDYVSGAMENTSASLFGEFVNGNFRQQRDKNAEDVVSHELFHQWFGDYVTAESWSNLTVNESFATYGEVLWREYKYGKANADALRYDDLQRYLTATERADPSLVRFNYEDKEAMFDRVSYQKGGAILHYIRGLAGDAAFDRAMQLYLTKNALQPAEAHHWRLALEEATGRDWNPFFNQWYFRGGHPELEVQTFTDSSAGKATVVVKQKNESLYQLPLKAALLYGNSWEWTDWNLRRRTDTFVYAFKNGLRPVIVPDAQHWLPGLIQEVKTDADWLEQYSSAPDHISKRVALQAVPPDSSRQLALEMYETALKDNDRVLRQLALQRLASARTSAAWQAALRQPVLDIAQSNDTPSVKAAAVVLLGSWKSAAYRREIDAALDDSSYLVAAAGLRALERLDSAAAYAAAGRLLRADSKGDALSQALRTVAKSGQSADEAVVTGQPERFGGTRNAVYLSSVATYAAAIPDSSVFNDVISQMQQWYRNEQGGTYREIQLYAWSEFPDRLDAAKGYPAAEKTRRKAVVASALTAMQAAETREETRNKLKEILKRLRQQ